MHEEEELEDELEEDEQLEEDDLEVEEDKHELDEHEEHLHRHSVCIICFTRDNDSRHTHCQSTSLGALA